MTKRSLASNIRKHGQSSDEVLNAITDLIGLASQGWSIAHGPEKSGQMVAQLISQLAARYAITSLAPVQVAKDVHQMTLNAMLIYLRDMMAREHTATKVIIEQELLQAGAYLPEKMRN